MSWATIAIVVAAVAGGAYLVARTGGRAWLRFRGARLIECPENKQTAIVEVDAVRAASGALLGRLDLRLSDCSRWPERQRCGQECLRQIERSPEDCLVRTIVTAWYKGKSCVLCGKSLDGIDWYERRPALVGPDNLTVQWPEVPAERLPEFLSTHKPLCWNCHIAETFRRQHPDLIVDSRSTSRPS
jgi:hypothetical protein